MTNNEAIQWLRALRIVLAQCKADKIDEALQTAIETLGGKLSSDRREMRVYISGAITGTDDYMERFAAAEKDLISQGYTVINPSKVNSNLPEGISYDEYMQVSMCLLQLCDAIYMLEGWQESNGANMELKRAKELDLLVLYYQPPE